MLETFLVSFKLRITYVANSIIYSLKQLPLIGKTISNSCYSDKGFKIVAFIIAILKTIFWDIFFKKFLYVVIMLITIPAGIQSLINETEEFELGMPILTSFVFLTIIGGIINNTMFLTSQDKYYAMFTMKINAKKYMIINYISTLIKIIIGLYISFLIFTLTETLSSIVVLLMPIFVVLVKIIFTGINIVYFEHTGKISSGKTIGFVNTFIILSSLILAYLLPILNINISEQLFIIIFILSLIGGIISLFKIFKYNDYRRAYKSSNEEENNIEIKNMDGKSASQIQKQQVLGQLDIGKKFESNKKGYAFFNELFMRRHKKIVDDAIKLETIIIVVIIAITIFLVGIIKSEEISQSVNDFLLRSLPYFTLIMFWLNRSQVITQAMYMNCDHSMLTYKFYRTPKAILGLFKERLKTVIKVNLIPSTVIAIALPVLLFMSGGTNNNINYLILFTSIIAMSIFFSTHYLVIYYLLQPYNKESELKGSSFKVVQTITIIACYIFSDLKLDTFIFGILMILFCVAYLIIAMSLVYNKAPKTFKIRN